MSTVSLATATMHEIIAELEQRADAGEQLMGPGKSPERHIRSAIDELRIACSEAQAIVDSITGRPR